LRIVSCRLAIQQSRDSHGLGLPALNLQAVLNFRPARFTCQSGFFLVK
jgi:hypothetical protein